MKEELFRQKSLDKMKSPENLDEYIRVSNPGVWLLLISIILLLVGACIWGVFGSIDSIVTADVRVESGEAVCYIADGDIANVQTGMTVKFSDVQAVITGIGDKGSSGYTCSLSCDATLPDGFYEGKIVIRSYKPLSFILN